jgi:Domain of unknown function (DUF5671)
VGLPLPPSPSDAAPKFTGRAAYSLSQLYYYLVAIVAIGFVIGGTIAALIALRQLAWPDPGSVTRQSLEALLQGLAFAIPGALAAWWHLGQARRQEGRVAAGAFWGRSLYFHAVAFLAYVVALGGVVATLFSLIDAAFAADCPVTIGRDLGFLVCTDADDALRAALNGLIVVLVAGTVWWWHLREGRRTVSP